MAMPARRLTAVDTSTRATVFLTLLMIPGEWAFASKPRPPCEDNGGIFATGLDGAPASAYTTGKIRQPVTRLYLISPPRIEHPSIFADELRAALAGGAAAA